MPRATWYSTSVNIGNASHDNANVYKRQSPSNQWTGHPFLEICQMNADGVAFLLVVCEINLTVLRRAGPSRFQNGANQIDTISLQQLSEVRPVETRSFQREHRQHRRRPESQINRIWPEGNWIRLYRPRQLGRVCFSLWFNEQMHLRRDPTQLVHARLSFRLSPSASRKESYYEIDIRWRRCFAGLCPRWYGSSFESSAVAAVCCS